MIRGKGPGYTPTPALPLSTVTYDPPESKNPTLRVNNQLMIHLIEIRKNILDPEDIIGKLKKMTKMKGILLFYL